MARRSFLGTLALGPAALAACASGKGASARGTTAAAASPPEPATLDETRLGAVRGFPLPADAAPAFVFRAAAVRPGER